MAFLDRHPRLHAAAHWCSAVVAFAKILSSECAPARVTQRIADYFGNQNPRFATDRFIAAASCKR
jgi:hypothetical protein